MKHRDFKNKIENSHPEQKEKSAAFAIIFIFTSSFLKTNEKKTHRIPKHTAKKGLFFFFSKMQAARTETPHVKVIDCVILHPFKISLKKTKRSPV